MKQIDFVKNKKIFFSISIIMMLLSLLGGLVRGYNVCIDFSGGTEITYFLEEDAEVEPDDSISVVQSVVGDVVVTAQIQRTLDTEVSGGSLQLILIQVGGGVALTPEQLSELDIKMAEAYNLSVDPATQTPRRDSNTVEPTIGRELTRNATRSLIVASLLLVAYVAFRFRTIKGFSSAFIGLAALTQDAIVILALYSWFQLPINETFVVVILTSIGYSINDTIILYDRIRENMSRMKKASEYEIANASVRQIMARSINTTLTTLFAVGSVYVLAVIFNIPPLIQFSLPIMLGVIVGSYTTLCVVGPLWAVWQTRKTKKQNKAKRVAAASAAKG